MKFIEEKNLREAFWKHYGYRSNILRYQFECPIRVGGVDLLTIEEFNGRIMVVAFEFKLADIKKALAQAEENLKYAHKSFIVVPEDKIQTVVDKYSDWIKSKKYIGVIGVNLEGKWTMPIKAQLQTDSNLSFNQMLCKIMLGKL